MKMNKPDDIIKSTSDAMEIISPGGGDDFLSRINRTITNFKELLAIAHQFQGLNPDNQSNKRSDNPGGGIAQFIQVLIAEGYGDTPVGKLIEQVSPYTIKQLMGMAKNVGPKR